MVLWKNEAIVAIAFDRPYRDYYRILYREEDSSFRKREPKASANHETIIERVTIRKRFANSPKISPMFFAQKKGILVRRDERSLMKVNRKSRNKRAPITATDHDDSRANAQRVSELLSGTSRPTTGPCRFVQERRPNPLPPCDSGPETRRDR